MIDIKESNWKKFKFHTKFTKSGCRIYVGSNKTKYYVGGCGYDIESSVIAKMINDLIGKQDYKHSYTGSSGSIRELSYGIGVDAIKYALKQIDCSLELIYYGDDFNAYEIDLSGVIK